jgi:hypothetical protein
MMVRLPLKIDSRLSDGSQPSEVASATVAKTQRAVRLSRTAQQSYRCVVRRNGLKLEGKAHAQTNGAQQLILLR